MCGKSSTDRSNVDVDVKSGPVFCFSSILIKALTQVVTFKALTFTVGVLPCCGLQSLNTGEAILAF